MRSIQHVDKSCFASEAPGDKTFEATAADSSQPQHGVHNMQRCNQNWSV